MKKIQFLFFALTSLLFQSCFGGHVERFEDIVSSITRKTGVEIEKRYTFLKLSGVGGAMSEEEVIEHETLAFNVRRKLTKEEGINLVASMVDLHIKNMYSEDRLTSYLEKHSFTYKNIRIELFIFDSDGSVVLHPNLKFISLDEGMISYSSISEPKFYKEASYEEEPYEEALKRISKD